jgi:hypothetical protein
MFPPLATLCRAAGAALSSAPARLTEHVFGSSCGRASARNTEVKEPPGIAVNDVTNPLAPPSRELYFPLERVSQAKARRNSGCESAPAIERRAARLTASRRRRGDTR